LQVWGGLASGSVVGLALLFPIAAAIEETGAVRTMGKTVEKPGKTMKNHGKTMEI